MAKKGNILDALDDDLARLGPSEQDRVHSEDDDLDDGHLSPSGFRADPPIQEPKLPRRSSTPSAFREEPPVQDGKSVAKKVMSLERKIARRIAKRAAEIEKENLEKIDKTKPIQDQVKTHAALGQHRRIAIWQAIAEDELVPLSMRVKAMEKLDERAIGKAGQQDMTREKAPIKIIRPQVGDDIT